MRARRVALRAEPLLLGLGATGIVAVDARVAAVAVDARVAAVAVAGGAVLGSLGALRYALPMLGYGVTPGNGGG
jgi:hypothetical protein